MSEYLENLYQGAKSSYDTYVQPYLEPTIASTKKVLCSGKKIALSGLIRFLSVIIYIYGCLEIYAKRMVDPFEDEDDLDVVNDGQDGNITRIGLLTVKEGDRDFEWFSEERILFASKANEELSGKGRKKCLESIRDHSIHRDSLDETYLFEFQSGGQTGCILARKSEIEADDFFDRFKLNADLRCLSAEIFGDALHISNVMDDLNRYLMVPSSDIMVDQLVGESGNFIVVSKHRLQFIDAEATLHERSLGDRLQQPPKAMDSDTHNE